ncbi:hypothetical protein PBCV1_a272R [Paramecium bursaria Chlorella virus 1]|uniref:Uncharacterized protein n=1 Tax=Paramecium bursaria Chlorella virus 1 TaxID=10506 RepID=Q84589_PBCV1|nr:hypothetical protein PBCV1_a272R [Paramecium bursaria Chlorella virus 1]AAC96640.1 hypothetical protein [Paramecium bursaria Chlorella virus 1]
MACQRVVKPMSVEFLVKGVTVRFQHPRVGEEFCQERHHDETDFINESFRQLVHRRNQETVARVLFKF